MMDENEIHQMDEFAQNFLMLCYCIAMGVVAVAFLGWAYFFIADHVL